MQSLASSSHYWLTILVVFFVGCSQNGGDEPDSIEALDGSVSCSADESGDTWQFGIRVAGPATEGGTTVFVDVGGEASSVGFAMTVIGEDPEGRLEFYTTAPGTAAGDSPEPGQVPLSCDDEASAQFRFCATHSSTLDEPCWACGEDDGSSPPGGAVGWIGC